MYNQYNLTYMLISYLLKYNLSCTSQDFFSIVPLEVYTRQIGLG